MNKFYLEIYKLKNLLRKGWLDMNAHDVSTGRVESDAEHTFSMALLTMEIMEKSKKYSNLDKLKVYEMVLVHELCEIDAGDHTPRDDISQQEKYELELAGVKRLAKEYKMPNLLKLWLEFKNDKSAEAEFVRKLDRLDAILQAEIYDELLSEFKNRSIKIAEEFKDFL